MKTKRMALRALAALALALGLPCAAHAQYPERPITLIVPYAPGGTVDAFARTLVSEMESRLGKPVVIENVAGAGGMIGVAKATRAQPDGYTVLMGIVSDVVLAPLTEPSARYSYRDLEAIAPLGTSGVGVVAHPGLHIGSLSQLIDYARKNPGKISYGATGAGSLPALAMEEVKRRAGLDMAFIPYASASKIALDVMGGHLDVAVSGLPALLEPIKSGKVSGVGVLSKDHDLGDESLPSAGDTPELKGMDFYFWTGLFAPKRTPPAIVQKLNAAFADSLKVARVRAKFAEYGVRISEPQSPQAFGQFVARSHADWEAIVKRLPPVK